MNEKKFTELIRRYEAGDVTEGERVLVENWLHERSTSDLFGVMPAEDRRQIKDAMLTQVMGRIRQRREKISRTPVVLWPSVFRVAAALLLLGVVSYLLWQLGYASRQKTVETISLQTGTKIVLPDNTLVWLKSNSTLTYPEAFTGSTRPVSLHGEALFEVAKDPAHPFIIRCGQLTARVLGTSFNLKTRGNGVEVTVFTGQVALSPSAPGTVPEVVVLPNERAIYTPATNRIAKQPATGEEIQTLARGTTYAMRFEDIRLEEVSRRIEEKFNVKIVAEEAALNNCLITANLTDQSLQRTLEIITSMLGAKYEIEDNRIMLKGNGCPR